MKPFNTGLLRGPKTRLNGSTVVAQTGPWRAEVLTASPLIKGDRKRPNPHQYEYRQVTYPYGKNYWLWSYDWTPRNTGRVYQDGWVGWDATHPFLNGVSFPGSLRNRVLDKLNEKTRGSLDLSVDLAQAGQTARMFRASENAKMFAQTFRGWRGLIKGVADARLAFVYGWKPLATDIYDAANEAINAIVSKYTTIKVRASEPIHSSTEYFPFEFYGSAPGLCTRNGRYLAELCVTIETKDRDVARWTSLNPVSIAWELVPYSFVFDWVVDVGSYLRNLETSLLYANRFVSGYSSEGIFFDSDWHSSVSRRQGSWPTNVYTVDANAHFRYRKFQRSILTSYPVPRLPTFKAELGTGRLLNLAALIGSKLKVR